MNTNICRTLAIGVSILSALAFLPARFAFAQPGKPLVGFPDFTLKFDEQGNNLLQFNNPSLGSMVLPTNPTAIGLEFLLPVSVASGDVLVQATHDIDTLKNPNGDSDLLSFFDRPNNFGTLDHVMLFQSLIVDATDTLPADVNAFTFFNAAVPPSFASEIGPEGSNQFFWTPGLPTGTMYNGISDGTIPEPSTVVLGSLGLLSLAALAYRRSRWAKTV
jgi:hypothetical protein